MDIVARLMSLNEKELGCLGSDKGLISHLNLLIDSKLQQCSNASLNNKNYHSNLYDNHVLDLRVQSKSRRAKGEFDEPNPEEVKLRMKQLVLLDNNYHLENISNSKECACILGSQFAGRTSAGALRMIEEWRQMPLEQRLAWKWDTDDLPKDIALSDIDRLEDLRKEASRGRANFGGVSKRKPLGIRGTRQFLLILYCVWGHPGRDDAMQRDGYCPHCFAKIMKPNDQSILVRVVNHFNMKHKRGANPRQQVIVGAN